MRGRIRLWFDQKRYLQKKAEGRISPLLWDVILCANTHAQAKIKDYSALVGVSLWGRGLSHTLTPSLWGAPFLNSHETRKIQTINGRLRCDAASGLLRKAVSVQSIDQKNASDGFLTTYWRLQATVATACLHNTRRHKNMSANAQTHIYMGSCTHKYKNRTITNIHTLRYYELVCKY